MPSRSSILPLQYLHRPLRNLGRVVRHRLLQALRLYEIHVCEPLSFVDLDVRDRPEGLHGFFEEGFGHTLGGIGVLDEGSRCTWGGDWEWGLFAGGTSGSGTWEGSRGWWFVGHA